jgi:endonuclease G
MATQAKGYDRTFLGKALRLPAVDAQVCAPLVRGNGSEIRYTHYSAFVHRTRKLPLLTAVNIRGESFNAPTRTGKEPWDYSDQIGREYQVDNSFYAKDDNTFDRGHLVRRIDPCWGSDAAAREAELETFRWINCTPQHKKLNQRGGAWFQLEQHVMEHGVKGKIADISVFSGAVLDPSDKVFIKPYRGSDLQIPLVFWKVIVWKKSDGKLYAVGFMMSQWEWIKSKLRDVERAVRYALPRTIRLEDEYFEQLKFDNHATYQVPVASIERATGISFGWKNVRFPYSAKRPAKVTATPSSRMAIAANRSGERAFAAAPGVRRRMIGRPSPRATRAYRLSGVAL